MSNKDEDFDLTTKDGFWAAIAKEWQNELDCMPAYKKAMYFAFPTVLPAELFARKALKVALELFDSGRVIEAQQEAAISIIEAGRKNGVSKIRIKMSANAGANLNLDIPDVRIKFGGKFGNEGIIELDVEYP